MPRPPPNPAPRTAAAKEALKTFYCTLCAKGYSRSTEFEAHESSYDHQHKKRLKDMREMQKDPGAVARARKAERKADEKAGGMFTIKPMKLGGSKEVKSEAKSDSGAVTGAGFKKGGFKSAFGGRNADSEKEAETEAETKVQNDEESESDMEYERYDPLKPTGCGEGCLGRLAVTT